MGKANEEENWKVMDGDICVAEFRLKYNAVNFEKINRTNCYDELKVVKG